MEEELNSEQTLDSVLQENLQLRAQIASMDNDLNVISDKLEGYKQKYNTQKTNIDNYKKRINELKIAIETIEENKAKCKKEESLLVPSNKPEQIKETLITPNKEELTEIAFDPKPNGLIISKSTEIAVVGEFTELLPERMQLNNKKIYTITCKIESGYKYYLKFLLDGIPIVNSSLPQCKGPTGNSWNFIIVNRDNTEIIKDYINPKVTLINNNRSQKKSAKKD